MDRNNEDDDNDSVDSGASREIDVELVAQNEQRFLGLGYNAPDEAYNLAFVKTMLTQETARLNRYAEGPKKPPGEGEESVDFSVGNDITGASPPLLHNDLLLPQWRAFAEALASVPARANGKGYIRLLLTNLQFGNAVQDLLIEAMRKAPLEGLVLLHNGPGTEGVAFAINMINAALPDAVTNFSLHDRHLDLEHASLLVQALLDHPSIDCIGLNSCGIGEQKELVRAVIPTLHHITEVSLQSNGIGSYGAALIANIVAGNPDLEFLFLDGNILDDGDATMLSLSLKTNTKLRRLSLANNRIAFDGKKALYDAVFNNGTGPDRWNLMHESNHTCRITGFDDAASNIDATFAMANEYMNPELNWTLKMLNLLPTFGEISDLRHLFGFPLGVAPRIIVLLQGNGFLTDSANAFNGVYLFMRHWNMPLLYTNSNCGNDCKGLLEASAPPPNPSFEED